MYIHTQDGKEYHLIDMAGQNIPDSTIVSAVEYEDGGWFVFPEPVRWSALSRLHQAGQKIASALNEAHNAAVLIEKRQIGEKLAVALNALYDLLEEIDASDPLLEFRKKPAR
jgi:hypothetical protein